MAQKKYRPYTTAEKKAYAKQFSSSERKSYRAGKRLGFLEGVHKVPANKTRKRFANERTYSSEETRKLFTNLNDVKI